MPPFRSLMWKLCCILLLALGGGSPARAGSTAVADTIFATHALALADEVRVRVLEKKNPREVTVVGAETGLTLVNEADGSLVSTLDAGVRATVKAEHGRVYVYLPRRVVSVQSLGIDPGPSGSTTVAAGRTTRRYEGTFSVESERGRLRLVNTVPLEAYVASVTAGEYPFREIEGVKAQAVLARTYALRSKGKRGAYDLVDHTSDQVYHGADRATDVTRAAADATRGVVLTYDGSLAETVYSSSNGGHIAANESAWSGAPVPYLRARPDPYDRASPHARWQTTHGVAEVHRALSRAAGFSVSGFEVAARSAEGRVTSVLLTGARRQRMRGSTFRATLTRAFGMLTLKSTFFDVARRGGSYVFSGRGFGHGVGMSQYGARAQAQAGRGYQDILAFYFRGATLTESTPGLGPERPLLASVNADATALREAVVGTAPAVDTETQANPTADDGPRGWTDTASTNPTPEAPPTERLDRRIAW